MTPRLTSTAWVSALLRRVHASGDTAAVLRRGEASAGAVLLVQRSRDGSLTVWQRVTGAGGRLGWTIMRRAEAESAHEVDEFLQRQQRYDDDLWVIELNTETLARFIDDEILFD